VYLFALGATWLIGFRGLVEMTDVRLQGIRAAFLGAFTAALVTGLLDHYFANQSFPHAVALFWLYAAILVASSRLSGLAPRQAEPERAAATRTRALGAYPTAMQRNQVPDN
jgi:hypothetical protein